MMIVGAGWIVNLLEQVGQTRLVPQRQSDGQLQMIGAIEMPESAASAPTAAGTCPWRTWLPAARTGVPGRRTRDAQTAATATGLKRLRCLFIGVLLNQGNCDTNLKK